jgi:hypothetical protein
MVSSWSSRFVLSALALESMPILAYLSDLGLKESRSRAARPGLRRQKTW